MVKNWNKCEEFKFATWNVIGVKGKENELMDTMKEYKIDVLCISESKKKGWCEEEVNGVFCLWSGVEINDRAQCGVGVLVSDRMKQYIRSYNCVSSRILWLRLKVGFHRIFIVATYGPNDCASDLEKDQFWDSLHCVIDSCDSGEKVVICGDLNGWVGVKRSSTENVLGQFGDSRVNDNGERIVSFCLERNVFISNTFFKHKLAHLYTWENVTMNRKSIIDFIIYDERLRKCVVDTRVKRGAELGTNDHYLVVSRIRFDKCWRMKVKKSEKMFRVKSSALMNEDVRNLFVEKLDESLPVCDSNFDCSINDVWMKFRNIVYDCAKDVCGVSRLGSCPKNMWWNDEVKEAIAEKKKAYLKYLNVKDLPGVLRDECLLEYKRKNKFVKRIVSESKRSVNKLINERLTNDFSSNQKLFWMGVKKLRVENVKSVRTIKNADGELLWNESDVKNRWYEYFVNLYGGVHAESDRNDSVISADVSVFNIDDSDVRYELMRLKNGKAAGMDGITNEMLKYGGVRLFEWLVYLFKFCLNHCVVPDDWKKAVICPLFKGKGSSSECTNFRAISLLSVVGKLFTKILIHKVRTLTISNLSDVQGGFLPGRGCVDQLFSLRMIVEKSLEKNKRVFCGFLDIKKAYDSVLRPILWKVLADYGVNGNLLGVIQALYEGSMAAVRIDGKLSDWFRIDVGVKQGCVMSPWLFNLYMDVLLRKALNNVDGVRIGDNVVSVLAYADDLVVLGENVEQLNRMICSINDVGRDMNLALNENKCKVIVFERSETVTECNVLINGVRLEQVNDFVYLGSVMSRDGRIDREIDRRVSAGCKILGALGAFARSVDICREARLSVYRGVLVPVLMYGSESWAWMKKHKRKLTAVEMRFLRGVCGYTRRDHVRNTLVYEECTIDMNVVKKVGSSQLRWFGHMERMPGERLTKRIYVGEIEGERARGRPKKKWINMIEECLKEKKILSGRNRRACMRRVMNVEEAKVVCQDRKVWRRLILHEK